MLKLPLQSGIGNARQQFSVTLGDFNFSISVYYLSAFDTPSWGCDIDIDGTRVVSGAMLRPGSDLLEHYQELVAGHLVFVGEDPTIDNLGSSNSLIWVGPDE